MPPFEWDHHSDQPKIIRDKSYKRRMRLRHWTDYLGMAATSLVMLPIGLFDMARGGTTRSDREHKAKPSVDLFGMGVSLDKGESQLDLIGDLGVRHVLMRVPMWDVRRLDAYRRFAEAFSRSGKTVLINILQDREHIEDPDLLKGSAIDIFSAFDGIAERFQVGNAINRIKWGFFSVEEYLEFSKTIQNIRDERFAHFKLLGPAVIDFEYHYTVRALFSQSKVTFDQMSALLYVDRMGPPDAKQYGFFDTDRKIRLLAALAQRSRNVKQSGITITEVNWPLSDTAPYAPTSETECISPELYSDYMAQYHHIAMQTGCVDRIYWHQLIAPGYGLIDNRDGKCVKRPGYERYKQMILSAQRQI